MAALLPVLLLGCAPVPAGKAPAESTPLGDSAPLTDSHSGASDDSQGGDSDSARTWPDDAPPAVILMIGDGMGFRHVAGGGDYKNGAAGTLTMETLPVQGRLRTASLGGITDSAAAATSYAAGVKTWNGILGEDRYNSSVESVTELARSLGMGTGVVTTDTLTGATPAAFLVHDPSRGDSTGIAAQITASLPDVLLGGGSDYIEPDLDGLDVQLVHSGAELLAAEQDDRPLVGLFSASTFPWVVDGYGEAPTLAQMTSVALDHLSDHADGFFLMVEGARIDHASHGMNATRVHPETAAFDDAVAAAMTWAEGRPNTTLLVTADHECGGLMVADTGTPGETPETTFRWSQHTNADVPILAQGDAASVLDGQRSDALWVHQVLVGALTQSEVTPPELVPLSDGWLDDLGDRVSAQTWDTSFGAGYNQLDALRVWSDSDGLRVGVDGAFDREENAVVLLFDVDYGAGTGLGGSGDALPDVDGQLDSLLSSMNLDIEVDGLGFDLAIGVIAAYEVTIGDLLDNAGLRGLAEPWASDGDLGWMPSVVNFDDGNVAFAGDAAPDAAATGETENGLEVRLPWNSVWPEGIPDDGVDVAVVALLVSSDGALASNQALPPLPTDIGLSSGDIPIDAVAVIHVDSHGNPVGDVEVGE